MNALPNGVQITGLFAVTLLLCGCFQAENPFYRESDIITDKRLEGKFRSNKASSSEYIVIKPGKEKHYLLTYYEDSSWVVFDAVLFRCGTNLFVDLSKIADGGSSPPRSPGDPVPTGIQIAHLATIYDSHFVNRVRFVEDGFQVAAEHGNPVYDVLRQHPGLRFRKGTEKQPLDEKIRILTNPTEELYKLLLEEGSNEDIFGFKSVTMRREG